MTNKKRTELPVKQPAFTVDRTNLDASRYAESLFAEALRLGAACEKDIDRFLGGVLTLLKKAIELQSDGESTSVKEETAGRMIASILYVIGVALRQMASPEDAVRRMVAESTEKIYDEGLGTLLRLRSQAELLRLLLMRTKKPDQSDAYYAFIDITVKRYLASYDPRLDAAAGVWVRLEELGVNGKVEGMLEVYSLMRRLYEYNTK